MTVRSLLPGQWEQLERVLTAQFDIMYPTSSSQGLAICPALGSRGRFSASGAGDIVEGHQGRGSRSGVDGAGGCEDSSSSSSAASFDRRLDEARLRVVSKQQQVGWPYIGAGEQQGGRNRGDAGGGCLRGGGGAEAYILGCRI